MSNDTQQHFADSAIVSGGGESVSEQSLELREGAFNLPSLSKQFSRKIVLHFQAVLSRFHRSFITPRIDRDGGALNAQLLAAKRMKRLAVISPVCRQGFQAEVRGGLLNSFAKMAGIVGGSQVNHGRCNQVSLMFANQRQLDPAAVTLHAGALFQKVATDITAFKSCGINRSGGGIGQQSPFSGPFKHKRQDALKGPFFSRRFSAFWSVVK